MSAISTCPKCDRQITIPAGVDSAVLVRCPLCRAEYPLSDALAMAPPELIAIGTPMSEHTSASASVGEYAVATDQGPPGRVAEGTPFPAGPLSARRMRKPKSSLRTFFEVVSGAVAGTLVMYHLLAWYQGPAFPWPKLGLPWIERMTAAPSESDVKTKAPSTQKRLKSAGDAVPATAAPADGAPAKRDEPVKSGPSRGPGQSEKQGAKPKPES